MCVRARARGVCVCVYAYTHVCILTKKRTKHFAIYSMRFINAYIAPRTLPVKTICVAIVVTIYSRVIS